LDKIGLKNISDLDKRKLNKAIKRNEWYFKKLISEILDYFDLNNISDVIMEDLQSFGKTFIKSEEFDIKYSRLVRLLRLSNIKTWLNQQAEKRGIRVHITKPHYSSQQCSNCGNIDKNNRQNQEDFVCTECGFKINADFNSSINLKNRLTLDVLRSKLHKLDKFGRLIPRMMKKEKIKEILLM
jgi:putative transposase